MTECCAIVQRVTIDVGKRDGRKGTRLRGWLVTHTVKEFRRTANYQDLEQAWRWLVRFLLLTSDKETDHPSERKYHWGTGRKDIRVP